MNNHQCNHLHLDSARSNHIITLSLLSSQLRSLPDGSPRPAIMTVTMSIPTVTDQSIFPVDRHTYRTTIVVVTVLSRCIPTARYPIVILLVASNQSSQLVWVLSGWLTVRYLDSPLSSIVSLTVGDQKDC